MRGLDSINLVGLHLSDQSISRILEWLLESSTNTLTALAIQGMDMTKIPREISQFVKLDDLEIMGNSAPMTLQSGSLSFKSQIHLLWLTYSEINTIEPGVFQGIMIQLFLKSVLW